MYRPHKFRRRQNQSRESSKIEQNWYFDACVHQFVMVISVRSIKETLKVTL